MVFEVFVFNVQKYTFFVEWIKKITFFLGNVEIIPHFFCGMFRIIPHFFCGIPLYEPKIKNKNKEVLTTPE